MNKLQAKVNEIIEENGGMEFALQVLDHGCVSGVVTELIYYSQTHAWFDEYYEEINEMKLEFEEGTGEPLHIESDLKNELAWFTFELATDKWLAENE
jgi:hypothetical protein